MADNLSKTTDGKSSNGSAKDSEAPARKLAKIENPSLPKDRNARVREQAARKMDEAKTKGKPAAGVGGLNTGELVDDALARGFDSTLKWLRKNLRLIEGVAVVAVLAGIGYGIYDWQDTKRFETASDTLMKGLKTSQAPIKQQDDDAAEAEDPEEEMVRDTRLKYPTAAARREAALGAYRLASNQYANTGAGILARLGEAGQLLDARDYDGALKAFQDVLSTPLAQADAEVRMSATEGVGMALEGKGDVEGALKAFKTLENSDQRGYVELGLYHQARLLLIKKNEREVAKTLLLKVRDRLAGPAGEGPSGIRRQFVEKQVNMLLREIDPSSAPPKSPNPYDDMSIEQMIEMQKAMARFRRPQPQEPPPEPPPAPASAAPSGSSPSK